MRCSGPGPGVASGDAPHLQVLTELRAGVDVVTPVGELDVATAVQLRHVVLDPSVCSSSVLVMDLDQVTFVDSVGLGILVSSWRHVRSRQAHMVVVCTTTSTLTLLRTTRLDTILSVYGSLDEAMTPRPTWGPALQSAVAAG